MAFRETRVEEIEYLANSFKDIADSLQAVAKKMRQENFLTLVLQIDAVRRHYLDPCERLASDVSLHLKDQMHCAVTGELPKWQKSVQKAAYNKALLESKAAQAGLVKQPEAVKPTKRTLKKAVRKKKD